jgi:mRNA interferase RelE/StbE
VKYSVEVLRSAQKVLENLPADQQERVLAVLEGLREVPRPDGCKKLSGRDAWRVRIGDYRVIYEVADDAHRVIIVVIAHRKDAYR